MNFIINLCKYRINCKAFTFDLAFYYTCILYSMGYSKKRRYRKKQRGGEHAFTYPEEDFRFAQIYALIDNPDLKKSVISEMNKDNMLLFSEQDLPEQRVDPGTLKLELYKNIINAATNTDEKTGFEDFKTQLNSNTDFQTEYNDKNPFLIAFVKAINEASVKALGPMFQEKAFLKELFPLSGTYIDQAFSTASTSSTPGAASTASSSSSSSATTDPTITVAANLVSEITFPDNVDVNWPSLQNLSKLSRLNKIVINASNNQYSQIKSPSITELEINTITLTTVDQLAFLEACPKLKKITIVSSGLNVSITDVLEKLTSWEDKDVVLTNTKVKLETTNFNKFIGLIKSKRVKTISLPDTVKLETDTQKADLEKALKNSLFGDTTITRATGVEVKQIENYEQLKGCFPKDFRIVSEEDGSNYKYTVFKNGMFSGLSSAGTCEFTTDNSDPRKLTSITFKKGTSEIMLDGFTSLTEIIIDKDADDLKIVDINGCTTLTTLTIGATDFKNLESMNITGCTALTTSAMTFAKLDKLTSLNINNNGDSITTLTLSGCKALTKIDALPVSLTNFMLTDAPITDTNFLTPLVSLNKIDLTGCNKFDKLSLPDGLKTVLQTLILNQCTKLSSIDLDGFETIQTLNVETNILNPMSLTTVSLKGSTNLGNLTLPSSVTSLTITEAKQLPNSNFLTGLDKLTFLTLEGFVNNDFKTIDLTLCNKLVGKGCVGNLKTLSVSNCVNLTAINGLNNVSALTTLNITDVNAGFTSLVMTGCEALTTIGASLPMSLTKLELTGCKALKTIENLSTLTNLTDLKLTGCEALTTIGALPTSLQNLYISWDGEILRDKVVNLDFLNNLNTNLNSLTLKELNYEGPCELNNFTELTDLIITEQNVSKSFTSSIHGLTSLTITGSPDLTKIDELPSTLKTLIINDSNIRENTAKEFLKRLTKLEKLTLKSFVDYTIDSLPLTLETLVLEHSKITNGTKIFSGLKELKIKNDSTISNINLDMCRGNLETLNIENCESLVSITDITGFQNLTTLYIDNCPVTKLVISDCDKLETVSKLPTSLKKLSITNSKITGADFTYMTGLETFVFTDNTVVSSLVVSAAIASAPASAPAAANTITLPTSVKELTIVKISALTNITDLDLLKSTLTFLHIEDCANLSSEMVFDSFDMLTNVVISKCPKVPSFVINNCSKLTEIQGLNDMDALEIIQITENGQYGSHVTMPDIYSSIFKKSLKTIVLKGKSTNYLQTNCGFNTLPFDMLTSLTKIELENFKIINTGNSSPNLDLKFKNENTTPNNTLETISLKNIEYFDTTSKNGNIGLDVFNCNALTNLDFDNKTLFNIIIIRKCNTLKLIPGIEGFTYLEDLSIEGLSITNLTVSNCPKLKTIHRLTGLNELKTLTIKNNNSLTTIHDIHDLTTLETILVEECRILDSLTITKNDALTNVNLSKLPALKTLRIEELTILEIFDLSNLPDASTALETLTVYKNPKLESITGLRMLSALKTINVSDNAITGTIEDFLGGLHENSDKKIYLSKNAAMTLGDENKVIEYIGTKHVKLLNRTGTNTENKNNNIKALQTSDSGFKTDFEGDGVVNGINYDAFLSVDLNNMCKVLGKNECDVAFYTTINNSLTAKLNAAFDQTTVSINLVNGVNRITSLVLDGDQIDFTNLKGLNALKSLTIQNNSTIKDEFNTDKVLPHGLEELVITNCLNFSMVNLDDQKVSLKTLKISMPENLYHNTFMFEDFQKLTTVELGKGNESIYIKNCPTLETVSFHESTKEVTVISSPKFPLTALDRLTAIDSLELENQPTLVLSEDLQKKIKKLVLKNVSITTLDVKHLAVLEELEITGCFNLTSIEAVTPNIKNMVITGCNELTSIKATDKAAANTNSTLSELKDLNHLDIHDCKITKLTIIDCPLLGGATNDNSSSSAAAAVNIQKTLTLPKTLTELVIEGDGIFEQTISTLFDLETLIIANNISTTRITLPSTVKTCKITNSSLTTLKTENCRDALETLEIKDCNGFSNLNLDSSIENYVRQHFKLETLNINKGNIEKIGIFHSPSIKTLELPESVTQLSISENNALTKLTIPKNVTNATIEAFTVLTSIKYEGTVMTYFKVENCRELTEIPDFKSNTANFTLLQVSNCPEIKVDMVQYLGGVSGGSVSGGKAIVAIPGRSTNKTRKIYGGMNNKTRRFYRGGDPRTIESVNFTDSGFTMKNVDNLVKIIGTKSIKKMFIPDNVKTKIEGLKKANDFIDKVKNNNDQGVEIDKITNVEIQAEESYELKRNKIIAGLKGAFAAAEEERVRLEEVKKAAAAAAAAAEEAERVRLENEKKAADEEA